MNKEMKSLIEQRNELSKKIDFLEFELRNVCIYPEDRNRKREELDAVETEKEKIVKRIREIEDGARRDRSTNELKRVHEFVKIEIFDVGGVLPSGTLKLDNDLRLRGKLPCEHEIDVSVFDLLKLNGVESLLNPATVSVNCFYACSHKKHVSDTHYSKGKAYRFMFSFGRL